MGGRLAKTMARERGHRAKAWAAIVSGLLLLTLSGCAMSHKPDGETYEIPSLRVVFLDRPQIQAKYEEITGQSAVMMTPRLALDTQRRKEAVVGFYDYRTRTIYCPKMDFEICGHELHHAVLGRFHLETSRE
ncbi:hypothetical protein [Candidatus Nitrospira inopinata]|jgi:hypothetical protein|nr:hypothetical protein [Candidatus Nitrospira inopinata]